MLFMLGNLKFLENIYNRRILGKLKEIYASKSTFYEEILDVHILIHRKKGILIQSDIITNGF